MGRRTKAVLAEVLAERERQHAKWGEQNLPDGTHSGPWGQHMRDYARRDCEVAAKLGKCTWALILNEEVKEAFAETDKARLRAELLQVAAVAVQWVEAIDRRTKGGG